MPGSAVGRTVVPMRTTGRFQRADLVDLAIAVMFTVATAFITSKLHEQQPDRRSADLLAYLAIVLAGDGLAARRRRPLAAVVLTTVACAVFVARQYDGGPIFLSLPFALYTYATLATRKEAVTAAAASTAALIGPALLLDISRETIVWAVLFPGWAAAAVLLGQAQQAKREQLRALRDRARFLEESREAWARQQVSEERLRIARDVHDVVAHSLASINVQAGVGAHLMDREPEQARRSLLAIKQVSAESLADLRTTLTVLRSQGTDDEGHVPLAPAPGLANLGRLIEGAASTGLEIELRVVGPVGDLSPAVDLAAYRIVQESITNVLRHGGDASARVTVRHHADELELEVEDDGAGAGARATGPDHQAGHGIAGMAERAASVGGSVEAGPRAAGGFRVRAVLPREAPTPTEAGEARGEVRP
jgi:signal transduction histidine kinase